MIKKKYEKKIIPHSNYLEEYDYELPSEIPDDSLSKFVDVSLLIPYGEKNSVARGELLYAGIRNSVFPASGGERPIIDSVFTKDIIRSSYNYKTKSTVKLLERIDKVINGYICESTYIYEIYKLKGNEIVPEVHIDTVPRYQVCYKFGYEYKSELENLKVGEESERPIYTTHLKNLDPEDGGMTFGKNLNCIFNVSKDVGEDAIVLSERLANDFRFNYMDNIEFTISLDNQILKNLYGDKNNYKPFPLAGEYINEQGLVCAISNIEKNILAISKEIEKADEVYRVHGGLVYDIEVYCNNADLLENDYYLKSLYNANRTYIEQIARALNNLSDATMHPSTIYKKQKYTSTLTKKLRIDKVDLKNKIFVRIKIANNVGLMIGNKISNRHGAKGMTADVVPNGSIVADDGQQIDAMVNIASTINRENPGQLFEKDLNALNQSLKKYLRNSKDDTKTKYKNLIEWVRVANLPDLVEELEGCKDIMEHIIDHYKENDIVIKHDPYGRGMDYRRFRELVKFTMSITEVKPSVIYYKGKPMSRPHYYGKMFYFLLENGPFYDTSIRADEIITSKGSQSKKGESKKKHNTKYGTTSAKNSNLSTAIIINSIKPKDRKILTSGVNPIHDYMSAIGLEFANMDKKSGEKK